MGESVFSEITSTLTNLKLGGHIAFGLYIHLFIHTNLVSKISGTTSVRGMKFCKHFETNGPP